MNEQGEIHTLGIDAGQLSRLTIATNRIHMTTEHGLGQDEVVNQHQYADDDEHNRSATLVRISGGGKQVGDEADGKSRDDDLDDGQAHRFGHKTDPLRTSAFAQLAPRERRNAQDAQDDGQTIKRPPPSEYVRQVITCDATEGFRGDRHGFADDDGGEASENQHAGQCGDEARNTDIGDPETLPDADDEAHGKGDDDGQTPIDPLSFHQQRTDAADESHERTDRKIDVGRNDDHYHAYGQNDHICVLLNQRYETVRFKQDATCQNLEYDDDNEQCPYNAVLSCVVGDGGEQAAGFVLRRCWCRGPCAHRAATSLSLVMPRMRYSCVNPCFPTLSVTTPWLTV